MGGDQGWSRGGGGGGGGGDRLYSTMDGPVGQVIARTIYGMTLPCMGFN